LAQRWALSVYDAAYLQLALREGAALVTLDLRLAAAADAAAADAAAADAAAAPVLGRPLIL
jgi:predicted nucleic acid-binding protein